MIILLWQRGDLRELDDKVRAASEEERVFLLRELSLIGDRRMFRGSAAIFLTVVGLLALHHRLELILGLGHNTVLVASSICGAGIVMVWKPTIAKKLLVRDVDWWTLYRFS